MKELSIEEKAKAYDEAFERAKQWCNAPNVDKIPTFANRVIKEIFPELKESEDERIRKEIVDFINSSYERQALIITDEEKDNWIAWLEKQEEQKTTDKVEPKFHEGDWAVSNLDKKARQIRCLEVKEVDLEKEIQDHIRECLDVKFPTTNIELIKKDVAYTAKKFFELGLKASIDKELVEEVYSHIDSIKDTADRMTSGNFMHNRAAIKFSANTIVKVLELMGLKAQKGE